MPGTIRVTVNELVDLKGPGGRKYSIQVSLGGTAEETPRITASSEGGSGKTATRSYNTDFVFTTFSLKENVEFHLQDQKGVTVGTAKLPVSAIVSKGSRDEFLSLSHGGNLHIQTSFTLTEAEKARIAAVKANALKKRMSERAAGLPVNRTSSLPPRIAPEGEEKDKTASKAAEADRKDRKASRATLKSAGRSKTSGASRKPGPGPKGAKGTKEGGEAEKRVSLRRRGRSVSVTGGSPSVDGAANTADKARVLAELQTWSSKNDAALVSPKGGAPAASPSLGGDIVPEGVAKSLSKTVLEQEEREEDEEEYAEDEEDDEEEEDWSDEEDWEEEEEEEGRRGGGAGKIIRRVLGTVIFAAAVVLLTPQLRPKQLKF